MGEHVPVAAPSAMPSLRAFLRDATQEDHARLDRQASRFDVQTTDGYRGFLKWHARVLPPLEALLDVMPDLPDWPERRRAPALMADLASLNETVPAAVVMPPFEERAARIGALYVLEGSRLGGAILSCRVAQAQPHAPQSFLQHGGDARLWTRFIAWLEAQDISLGDVPELVYGARAAFRAYLGAIDERGGPEFLTRQPLS